MSEDIERRKEALDLEFKRVDSAIKHIDDADHWMIALVNASKIPKRDSFFVALQPRVNEAYARFDALTAILGEIRATVKKELDSIVVQQREALACEAPRARTASDDELRRYIVNGLKMYDISIDRITLERFPIARQAFASMVGYTSSDRPLEWVGIYRAKSPSAIRIVASTGAESSLSITIDIGDVTNRDILEAIVGTILSERQGEVKTGVEPLPYRRSTF